MNLEQPSRRTIADLQVLALLEILRAATSAVRLDDLLAVIANVAIVVADATNSWVMLAEGSRLRTVVSRGELADELAGKECDVQSATSCAVAAGDRPVLLQPDEIDPTDPVVGVLASLGQPVVLVPLKAAERTLGMLGAAVLPEAVQDIRFLTTVAAQASATIVSARAREEATIWRQHLDLVFEQIADGAAVFDREGRLALANAAARRLLDEKGVEVGDSLAEVIEKTGIANLEGRPLLPEETPTGRALAGRKLEDVEVALPMVGGTTHYYLFSATPVLVEGRIQGVVTVWRDITAQRLAEAGRVELAREQAAHAGAEARAQLAAIVESSEDAIIGETLDGIITSWNPAAERLYGYSAEEVTGQSRSLLVPADHPDELLRILERVGRGERIDRFETVRVRKDGRRVDVAVTVSPIKDAAGRVIGASTITSDISDRKRAEAERVRLLAREQQARAEAEQARDANAQLIIRALEAHRQREEFVSVIAHDLRNAITTIKGYADLLDRLAPRDGLPEQLRRAVAIIASTSRRTERMIADLLDMSGIEAHRLTLAKQPVDLLSLVRAIVERSEQMVRGHPVGIVAHGEIPPIEADPDRIEQVLSNLLSNAGKYSYRETAISIDLDPRPGEVVVSVTNHGVRIPPAEREKIFDRFHRTREAEQGEAAGLGLGLYIAKGLVEAHGGRIWVESTPGRTTTFRFTLPVAPRP